jgi:hypothetical protein
VFLVPLAFTIAAALKSQQKTQNLTKNAATNHVKRQTSRQKAKKYGFHSGYTRNPGTVCFRQDAADPLICNLVACFLLDCKLADQSCEALYMPSRVRTA